MTRRISAKPTAGAESRSEASVAADLLAVLRRDGLEVGDGQHLAGLHRRALHAPEDADDLLGRVDLPPAQCVVRLTGRTGRVDGARARVLGGLGRREAPERRGPPQPRGGDLASPARPVI